MEDEEKKFIKGFNHGYLLAKHEPALLEKLVQNLDTKNEYCNGLVSGGRSHKVEKMRNLAEKIKQNIPDKTNDKQKGIDIDR